MSLSASIDIHLLRTNKKAIPSMTIIDVLIETGWTLIQNNHIGYLPIGDKDDFNWQSEKNMDYSALKNIVETKETSKELIGIMMSWQNTDIGGAFLFYPEGTYKTISFSVNAFRPMITFNEYYEIIDFQWYLEKLLPPLNDAFGVEYFSCEQHK